MPSTVFGSGKTIVRYGEKGLVPPLMEPRIHQSK